MFFQVSPITFFPLFSTFFQLIISHIFPWPTNHFPSISLDDELTDLLINWLIDRLINCLVYRLIYSAVSWRSESYSLTHNCILTSLWFDFFSISLIRWHRFGFEIGSSDNILHNPDHCTLDAASLSNSGHLENFFKFSKIVTILFTEFSNTE